MDIEKFKKSPSGKLIKSPKGYWAFLPHALPPKINFTPQLIAALSAADRALGELAGVGSTLANPHLLIRPFVRREAVLSSRIEGTQASLSDLFFFEAGGQAPENRSDVREVANYVIALEYGLNRLKSLPMSLRLIRELHKRLMTGVRGGHQTPGDFRRSQNWIGPPGCTLDDATYVPPPANEMKAALAEFETYLHTESNLPPLIRLACLHYQFEAIHPFLDGNGRVGRLLITLLLCEWNLLPQPLLYLSAFFEKNRSHYYELLLRVSQEGDWLSWIIFFLKGVAEMAADAVIRSRRMQSLHSLYRQRFQTARSSGVLLSLIDYLFERPLINVGMVKSRLNVAFNTAQSNIDKLVKAGILKEVTGKTRYRFFVASEILATIEAPIAKRNSKILEAE